MPLKHGTSAALERRMDLASFFCMIGRHGPAVLLAVVAVLCLLAGLIVYWRLKRGRKRREATAAAGNGDAVAAAVETDASVEKRPGLRARSGDPRRLSPPESTDVSDDRSSEIKEDLFRHHVTLRHRCVAAASEKNCLYSPPVQEPTTREAEEGRDWTTEAEREEEPVGGVMEEVRGDEREEPEWIQDEDVLPSGKELEEEDLESPEDYDHEAEEEEEEEEELVPQQDQMDPSTPEKPQDWTGSPQLDQGTPVGAGRIMDHVEGSADDELENEEEVVVLPKESDQAKQEVPSSHETAEFDSSYPVLGPSPPDQEASLAFVDPCPEFSTNEDFLDLDCQQPMSEEIEEEVPGALPKEEEKEEKEPPASVLDESTEKTVDLCLTLQNGQMENNDHDVIDPKMAENQESVERIDDCSDPVDHDSAETITGEEVTRPDLMSFCQTLDHMDISKQFHGLALTIDSYNNGNNNETFMTSEETSDSVTRHEMQNTTQQIRLPPFTLRDADSSPGVGAESGISSMTVTPELQEEEFGRMVENMDCDPQCDRAEPRDYADDIIASVCNDDSAELSFGPQGPHGEVVRHSPAANEDVFGNEIEERYHRALEAAMVEIAANVARAVTDRIEVVPMKRIKMEKDEEEEKEDEYEKTEISIMEATMDNNEWITEGNYQVLPWMNGSSFPQDPTKPLADVSCIDTDSAPFGDVTSTPPPSDESYKKVVAVSPMPQTVSVTFRIHYLTHSLFQTVAITGNQPELGNWAEFIPLERAGGGHWVAVVSLPAESHVEWKFVLLEKGEVSRWEECGNRFLETGYGDELTVHKWWGLL